MANAREAISLLASDRAKWGQGPPQSVFHVNVRRRSLDPAYACLPAEASSRSLKALRSTLAKRAPGRRSLK